jgi:hypothetical protein
MFGWAPSWEEIDGGGQSPVEAAPSETRLVCIESESKEMIKWEMEEYFK